MMEKISALYRSTSALGSNLNSSPSTVLIETELATIDTFAQSLNVDLDGKI